MTNFGPGDGLKLFYRSLSSVGMYKNEMGRKNRRVSLADRNRFSPCFQASLGIRNDVFDDFLKNQIFENWVEERDKGGFSHTCRQILSGKARRQE